MNLLLDANLWGDNDGSPPVSWNPVAGRYEFLIMSENGVGGFLMNSEPAPAGSTISFDYQIDAYVNSGSLPSRFVLAGGDGGGEKFVVELDDLPVSGSFSIECEDGQGYAFYIDRPGGLGVTIYDFEAIITPTADPVPPEPGPCEEHGRATRAYVSGYQRDRVHRSRLVRGERRCLVANFNGAIPPARTIVTATWRCDQNQAIYMDNARITDAGRVAAVDITAQIGAGSRVKCEVTLDNGEIYNQLFVIRVISAPWFVGEQTYYSQGPTVLTATA